MNHKNITNTLIEKCNKSVVDTLSVMSYKYFLDIMKQTEWKFEAEDLSLEDNYKDQFNQIKQYCKMTKTNNYSLKVDYYKSSKQPTGRVYAKNGIQSIWGLIRGALTYDLYYDFDMVAAHHAILLYICNLHKVRCSELEYYVKNRNLCLSEMCELDNIGKREAKNLFIASINDETKKTKVNNKKIKYDKFIKFDTEMKYIQKELTAFYPNDWKEIKRANREYENRGGKLISRLCCELENTILQDVIKISTPNVLMYDGFMVEQNKISNVDQFLKTLNKRTNKYGVIWSEKEIDGSLVELFTNSDEIENISIVEETLNDIAKQLHAGYLKDRLYRCDSSVYLKLNDKWKCGTGCSSKCFIFTELFEAISLKLDLWVFDKTTNKSIEVNSSRKTIEDLIAFIINTTPVDEQFVNRIWDWTINKLYFKNGFYDFLSSSFQKNDGNTFHSIDYDLHFKSNPKIRKQIYSKVLDPIFTCYEDRNDYETRKQLRDYWMYYLSRGGAGCIIDKNWAVLTGERNCGKSLFIDLIKSVFREYCGCSVGKQLVYQDRLGDCAKELSWLLPYQHKRFLLMSELPVSPTKKKITFDGTKIKSISSGGDEFEVRQNYTNETNIKLQSNLICAFNDQPECTPSDAMDTCKVFECITKFVNTTEKQQFKNIKYLPKDDAVKTTFIYDKDVINEFMLMLIDAYKIPTEYPESLRIEYNNDNETDVDKWINLFEITNNQNDFLPNQTITDIINENSCVFKLKKAKSYLVGIGAKSTIVRQNTKTVRGLSGIRVAEV
jgi:hypothetical protein